ncbi:Pleiotropic drug resistance protein 1-like protein [Drosera capensis]
MVQHIKNNRNISFSLHVKVFCGICSPDVWKQKMTKALPQLQLTYRYLALTAAAKISIVDRWSGTARAKQKHPHGPCPGTFGNHSTRAVYDMREIQGAPKIKAGSNPAAWMLDVTTPAQEAALGVDFAEIYKSSDQFRRTNALIQELSIPEEGSKQLSFLTQFAQPFFTHFVAYLWKQHCSYWNNSLYASRRVVNSAFILGRKRKQDLFSSMAFMYISPLLLGVERLVFYRERSSAMYSAFFYALAQAVIEIPYLLMQTLLCGIIVHAMIGFEWTAAKFFLYLFFTFLTFVNIVR